MASLDTLYNAKEATGNGGSLDALYMGNNDNNDIGGLDSLYSGATSTNAIDLNAIEQIESNGKNSATSSAGAKGLYQFMPDTAAQYSKRLFGKGTRDASTLSPEQQNQMASAYFNDLLNEFDGNKDKAIAAYNWGQGNVEKDVKAHGNNWLEYAPLETQQYVNKYHKKEGGSEKPSATESFATGAIGALNDAGYKLRKMLHLDDDGDEEQMEEAHDVVSESKEANPLATKAGDFVGGAVLPVAAYASGAGAVAPFMEGAGALPTFLATNTAGSLASQAIEGQMPSLEQTGLDLLTAGVAEGVGHQLLKPGAKQVKNMFKGLFESELSNPELSNATRNYLAYSRVGELAKHLKVLRSENPNALLTDAYKKMAEEVPDVFKGDAGKDMYEITRKMKNNVNAENLADYAKSNASEWLDTAKGLAKTDSEARKIKTVAEAALANAKGSHKLFNTTEIPDEVIADTLLQKLGKTADDWMGFDSKIVKRVFGNSAFKKVEADANAVKEMIGKDTRRINRELKKLNGKTGVSENAKRSALNRQKTLNSKMAQYINDGMSGRRVHIADIQTAVKEVQEGQFNSEATRNVTKSFKELSDRFEAMQVHKLAVDKTLLGVVGKGAVKKAATAGVAATLGLPAVKVAGALTTVATAAGKAARASKVKNLTKAWELLNIEVGSGHMTFNQALEIMESGFKNKAAKAGRFSGSLREAVNGEDN